MRSSVSRVALRGASRVMSTRARQSSGLPSHRPFTASRYCSSSTAPSEMPPKPEGVEAVAGIDPMGGESGSTAIETVLGKGVSEAPVVGSVSAEPSADTPVSRVSTEGVMPLPAETPTSRDSTPVDMQPLSNENPSPKELQDTLQALLARNMSRSALWHYSNAMRVEGQPSVDSGVLKVILPVLGRTGWAPSSAEAIELALERKYSLGTGMYNCGFHAMSRSGDYDTILKFFEEMWKLPKESHPNAASYNYLIGAYVYRGAVDQAFDVLNDMKNRLVYPTFATYHALIAGCLRRRDSRRAYSTLLAVEKQRFDVSAMTVAQVLVSAAENDEFDHVTHLLSKLENALPKYSSELHRIGENRRPYRMRGTDKTAADDRAIIRGEPRPEIGAISAVLHCAFRGGRPEIAMRAWVMLEEFYPEVEAPNTFWYCLIGAFAGAGDFKSAFDIVGSMREKGLSPNLRELEVALVRPLSFDVTKIDEQYFRLVDRLDGGRTEDPKSNEDHTEEAQSSTDDQESHSKGLSEDLTPEHTENSVQEVLAASDVVEANKDDESESSLGALLSSNHTGDFNVAGSNRFAPESVGIEELNCIISACSIAQDLDRAFQTYDEVETRFKVEKNAGTYDALLEGCVVNRHVVGGLRILKEMESTGLRISGNTVHIATRLLLRGGRFTEVKELLRKVQDEGSVVPLQTYQILIRNFLKSNDPESATEIVKLAQERNVSLKALTGRLDYDSLEALKAVLGTDIFYDNPRSSSRMGSSRVAKSSQDADNSDLGTVD